MKKIPQDIVGDIAILKFPKKTLWITKKLKARKFLKETPNIKAVYEKTEKFSGRLRTHKTKWIAGLKTKIANYRENDCGFKFNIDEVYFSPRLSNERKVTAEEISKLIRGKKSKILVMFAGIAPYPIVLAKTLKKKKKFAKIYSNEINRKANAKAKENIHLNKLSEFIELVPGDASKIKSKDSFDVILMTRPNLKNTFLKSALKLSKSGTWIFYHGFGTKESVLKEIKRDAGKKIGKISLRKAGDIAAGKYRWLAKFKVI